MNRLIVVALTCIALADAYYPVRPNVSENYNLGILVEDIVGGEPATVNQAPWQTFTVLEKTFSEQDLCGGAIIGKKAVLTAAHCCDVYDVSEMRVRYGGIDRTNLLHESKVAHKIVWPTWTRAKLTGDWCVLILESQIKESAHVKIIEIADKEPAVGSTADLTGWGATYYKSALPIGLRHTELTIISNSACKSKWSVGGVPITENMICATSPTSSGCNGDSGGPLVVNNKLVGTVSFGHKECPKDSTVWPTIYASDAHGKTWIMEQVRKYNAN